MNCFIGHDNFNPTIIVIVVVAVSAITTTTIKTATACGRIDQYDLSYIIPW